MNIETAKQLDIVEYLSRLGYEPERKSGHHYWYCSPLRDEKTPSFKVNTKMNQWYDWGADAKTRHGNLIDFGILYHKCTVAEFLEKLDGPSIAIPKHQKRMHANSAADRNDQIQIVSVQTITARPLLKYLEIRRIAFDIAFKYCKEVHYKLRGKNYYSIGFPNNNGGYALRNAHVKSAAMPSGFSFIDNGAKDAAVFEGFFDFLSYKTLHRNQDEPKRNYIILNSAVFFETALPIMQSHHRNFLFFDTDKKGNELTESALKIDKEKFLDQRLLYRNYKDLNDWHMNLGRTEKQRLMHKL